jgi:2-keto-4-pentenoate hydratase
MCRGSPTGYIEAGRHRHQPTPTKLEAGHLILPGSCTRAIDISPGSVFRAEFAGLGTVTASLAKE